MTDDECLDDLVELLDPSVDLRGADPYPARVEGGVGPPVDDEAALVGAFGEVTLVPEPLEPVEVGGAVPLVAGVVPEAQRHGRERCPTHQLAANLGTGRGAVFVHHVHAHP